MTGENENVEGQGEENTSTPEGLDIANITDEEISNLDPATLVATSEPGDNEGSDPGSGEESSQASTDESDQGNESGDAGGAAAGEGSSDDGDEGEASTPAGEGEDEGTSSSSDSDSGESSSDDQSGDQGESGDDSGDSETPEFDFEAAYKEILAPFKAAKREVSVDNIKDARRLMQMGVDYSRKMELMKPHLRVLRTLENAKLLDIGKLNFLIDLDNKKPEAIKKLLKDNNIDPIDLNLEGDVNYTPTDHSPGEAEMLLTDVLDNIRDTDSFEDTIAAATGMDTKSRKNIKDNPELLATLNEHMGAGIYNKVMDKVANARMLGQLTGVSDLEAYHQVGDAMFQAGEFKDSSTETPSGTGDSSKDSAQNSSSEAAEKAKKDKERKRAAGSPRGAASDGKKRPIDLSKLTDDEISKMDVGSLLK